MWTPKEKRRTEVPADTCGICGDEVGQEQKAMQCDMCETWEHVTCVRVPDRVDDILYEAITKCRSKAIVYCCISCRKGGSLIKRMNKLESECALISEQRLASARECDEAQGALRQLRIDSKKEREELLAEVRELRLTLSTLNKKTPTDQSLGAGNRAREQMLSTVQVSEESENNNSGSDNRSGDEDSHTSRRRSSTVQPCGFKELRSRIDKFSGASGEDDFEVWLEDFVEATNDCGWSDTQRARWFSWFISGPAKSTWQRTLKPTDKSSWETIVSVYKGQCGVHMGPRTAYQHCHELQYRHFMSVQSLMNAMRDYQRMAPRKLTDDTLESILWNKVPVELQQEVKEITDGSVQELLQKLLRAKSVIAERKCRSRSSDVSGKALPHKQETKDSDANTAVDKENTRRTRNSTPTQGTAEATLRYTKCFNCSQRGHLAKDCTAPKKKSSSRRITDCQEESNPVSDPWICSVATTDDTLDATDSTKVSRRGPTYKVKVEVEGVRTRALLDHGAQVSIVRRQLLSHIREKWDWTLEQCHAKNLPFESQPVGAGGERLGTIGIVLLKVQVTDTDILREVPCYVLDSSKPLWGGEVSDCGIVIGTNALSSLGFDITHPDGTTVVPATIVEPQSKLNQVDQSQADATETQAVVRESQAD